MRSYELEMSGRWIFLCISGFLFIVAFSALSENKSADLLLSKSSSKSYIPDSWMTPEDEEESPLLQSFVKSATFGAGENAKIAYHVPSLKSAAASTLASSISKSPLKTEQLASSPHLTRSIQTDKPHARDSALRRLTTKAEKLGKQLHDHGVQAPTKSEWKEQVV